MSDRGCKTNPQIGGHAHPLHPAAPAFVSYGIVLVRVRLAASLKPFDRQRKLRQEFMSHRGIRRIITGPVSNQASRVTYA